MILPKSKLIKLVGLIALPLVIIQLTSCAHMTPLTAAAKEGDVATIKELLNKGAKIDEPNSGKWSATPLYWSLFNCKFETAGLLLKKGPMQIQLIPLGWHPYKWQFVVRM